MRPVRTVALLLCLASSAHATDGVLEINQTCAVDGGCFSGDAAGFPVTLASSGSYRLTSGLNYASDASAAIVVANSDVAIDLNGFTIKGTNTCTTGAGGWVTSCSQASGFSGIDGTGAVRVRVSNGRILGCGGVGIRLADAADVRDVQVSDCASIGIFLGSRSIADSVSAIGNRTVGISISSGSGSVRKCVATNNGAYGVLVGGGSTVSENTSDTNGLDGIFAGVGSTVQGNTVRSNGSYGLNLGSGASYRANTISSNAVGAVSAAGALNTGANACDGVPCP